MSERPNERSQPAVPEPALVSALRAAVSGHLNGEAAIELLLAEQTWLRMATFRSFIDYEDDPDVTGGPPMAWVDWRGALRALEARRLRASRGTGERILRIAASLAAGVPVDLSECVTNGLGRAHARMVADAIARAMDLPARA